jgi:hypothetical protein
MRPFLLDQSGVVSRAQLLGAGLTRTDVARLVRRRELSRLHPGVYVDHTGEPSWIQTSWAAVLAVAPAALAGQSALRAAEGPGSRRRTAPVEVVVAADRRLTPPAGVVLTRSRHLEERVLWQVGPPRLRYEEAVLDVAAAAPDELAMVEELARAVQGRRTTAARLHHALEGRERLSRSRFLRDVLDDVAAGASSVLEHGYLDRVERRHGLARARRQVRDRVGSGVVYRDVEYDGGLVVELDGRLFHDTAAQRDRDLDRDLDTAVTGRRTVRLSYGQVFDRPCRTAQRLAALLQAHGWRGRPRGCEAACPLA